MRTVFVIRYCYITGMHVWIQTKRHDCKSKLNRHNSFNDRFPCILLCHVCISKTFQLCGSYISTHQPHLNIYMHSPRWQQQQQQQTTSTTTKMHLHNRICYSDKSQGSLSDTHLQESKEIRKLPTKTGKMCRKLHRNSSSCNEISYLSEDT